MALCEKRKKEISKSSKMKHYPYPDTSRFADGRMPDARAWHVGTNNMVAAIRKLGRFFHLGSSDNDVTHGQFFGENINRVIKALRKPHG